MEAKQKENVVVACDPGSFETGIVILINGQITHASTSSNEEIMLLIRPFMGTRYKLRVVIEDIRPYSLRLTPEVIDTCKFIGELQYRLATARIAYELISRSEVKEWAYLGYKSHLEPLVKKKVRKRNEKKGLSNINADGTEKQGSHVWLDDRLIESCMRLEWSIPAQKGKGNVFGLSRHSWQALAVGTLYLKGYFETIKAQRKKRMLEKALKKSKKKL